ncbi:protein TMED8 isoform X3 [Anas platyrhynchos]|uniref:protein TMED8 isoform X3 n=1 Tax=Anas platyrhynchos TaxID=8839 RepID=UPI003AF2C3CC
MAAAPPAAPQGPRFEPPGGLSGASGNEDAAPRTEPEEQPGEPSEPSASQCGSQIRSPVSVGATEDLKEEGSTSKDQEAAELEEKLPDQTEPTKEEAVVRMTNYHIHQGGGDIVMIQSDHTGAVDILSAELETADLLGEQRKAQPPPLAPPTTWTMGKMKEFKTKMGKEKNARMVVKRGEVVTVRVPTHPDGKRLCWEFATDDYDIGFGVYFDWTTVTSTAITVQVSESSDEEDEEEEEEIEGLAPVGDVERGSKSYLRNRYGEIMPVYRRDSHREVQAGSHDYPEHLGGQEGVRETLTVEQPELGAQESGNQKTGWTTITFRLLRGISSSTPARPFLVPEMTPSPVLPADNVPLSQDLEDPSAVKSQSSAIAARAPRPGKKDFRPPLRTLAVPRALESPSGKTEPSEAWRKSPVCPKKPRKVLFEPRASEKDLDAEDLAVEELQGSPSPRWRHAMCLSDPAMAVLVGGEGVDQRSCKDALWKLEVDSDFWLPVGLQQENAMPSCLHGHTATYDPDTKRIYVFGGIKEDKDYSSIYILDTVTWKWLPVAAKGRMPMLTYHSATIYRKELFVFGGTSHKTASQAVGPCSNVLYVFNPEHEIWYQPISEGEKPLPRFGHSATLLKNKLLIFGGQRTSLYFSDMHILDLGFMEYTPVPFIAGQPSARCFHAALAVSDCKVLISGGCNARGALQDAFVFRLDTLSWSTVRHHDLCSVPRAGHTLLHLTSPHQMDVGKENKDEHNLHTVLVFGGSNCAGTFYNSTIKIQLDIG